MRGPRHKRYLLLRSDAPMGEETKKELAHLLAEKNPQMAKKAVWFDRALIVRTDNQELPALREGFKLVADGVTLRPSLSSGSIAKLKKALQGSGRGTDQW